MLKIEDATVKTHVDESLITAVNFVAADKAITVKVTGREYPYAITNATKEQFNETLAAINARRPIPLSQVTDTISVDVAHIGGVEWDPKKQTTFIQVGGKMPPTINETTEEQYQGYVKVIEDEKARLTEEAKKPNSLGMLLAKGPVSSRVA